MDARVPLEAHVRALLDQADRAAAAALDSRDYARLRKLSAALDNRDAALAAAATLDSLLAAIWELLEAEPPSPPAPSHVAQPPAIDSPRKFEVPRTNGSIGAITARPPLQVGKTKGQPRQPWTLHVSWKDGDASTEILTSKDGAAALKALVALILKRKGDAAIKDLRKVKCRGCPLISQQPDQDFRIAESRRLYNHGRAGNSSWYVLTNSTSDEKEDLMHTLGGLCGFSILIENAETNENQHQVENHNADDEDDLDDKI